MTIHLNIFSDYFGDIDVMIIPLSFSTGIKRAVGIFEHSEYKRDVHDKLFLIYDREIIILH